MNVKKMLTCGVLAVTAVILSGFALNAAIGTPLASANSPEDGQSESTYDGGHSDGSPSTEYSGGGGYMGGGWKPHHESEGSVKDSYNHEKKVKDSYNSEKKIKDSFNHEKTTKDSYNHEKTTKDSYNKPCEIEYASGVSTTTSLPLDTQVCHNQDNDPCKISSEGGDGSVLLPLDYQTCHNQDNDPTTTTVSSTASASDGHTLSQTCGNTGANPNSTQGGNFVPVNTQVPVQTSTCSLQYSETHSGTATCLQNGLVVVSQCQGQVEGPATQQTTTTIPFNGGFGSTPLSGSRELAKPASALGDPTSALAKPTSMFDNIVGGFLGILG